MREERPDADEDRIVQTQPSVFMTTDTDIVSERKERGNSFVRDGYEIVVEAIYVVNGKKKKKIRKKKLSNYMLTAESSMTKPKLMTDTEAKQDRKSVINLQSELEAINSLQLQTNQLPKAKEILAVKNEKVMAVQLNKPARTTKVLN